MFRRFFSGMMLTLLLISILTLAFNIQPVRATTIIVPDHYSTIQEAIHAASSGDTILVKAGTYSENVVVNKRLTITSESGADVTIVQAANPAKHVFQVDTVDYVNINGFTVRGSKGSPGVRPSGAGICLFYANHCNISNNVASDNQDGIFVSWYSSDNILTENKANLNSRNGIFLYGSSNKLRDNTMSNNAFNFGIGGGDYIHDIDTSNTVNGKPIYYWVNKQNKEVPSDARYVGIVNCINITIMDLVLSNNEQGVLFVNVNNSKIKNVNVRSMKEFGIYLKSSSNNIVANNSINSSSRLSGIGLSSSNNNSVINNIISNNQDGIRLYGSNNNTISNNHILNNRRGILLSSSSNNTITTNIVNSNNGTGIYLEYSSSNNAVINNNVLNNMYGIAFYSYGPLNNTIYLNNFNNTNNVGYSTYASIGKWNSPSPIIYTYNGSTYTNYLGNYWSDYTGVDLYSGPYQNETGSDGIWDHPYVIDIDNQDHYPLVNPWAPTPTYIQGIDVSHHQWEINWTEVYGAGYRFAFVKASEGEGWFDPNFTANMENGYTAGLSMGAYHFARPDLGNDAADEAMYFVSIAEDYLSEGYLRPALDLEKGASLGKEALSNWVHTWIGTVKNETGIEPIIYSNSDYANNYLNTSVAKYNLWIAHWTYNASASPNTGIWDNWDFWQWSNESIYAPSGYVPGVEGNVDLDVFNGNMYELYDAFVIPNQPLTCSIELQKDGVEIDKVDRTEFFDIYVGDSTDNGDNIEQVRFSSDESQNGVPEGEWTNWYNWTASAGDWNATTKIKRWSFATCGYKEVWAQIKDDLGETSSSCANIQANAEWLFMVYLDADNNLESMGIEDFLEMSSVGSSPDVKIAVQMDRIGPANLGTYAHMDNASYGNWTGCKRFLVTKGMTPTSGEDLGEVNMGDYQTLVNFVAWATNKQPANNYILVLWDHGGGCKPGAGVCYDSTSGNDPIDMMELKQAMSSIKASLGKNVEILGFDACLMGMMEVACQVEDTADIFIGSQELIPGDGWPYDDILEELTANPSTSPSSLASEIVSYYVSSYQGGSQGTDEYVTLAAFNLHNWNVLVPIVNTFASELTRVTSIYHSQITEARASTENFNHQESESDRIYFDLYDFAWRIEEELYFDPTIRDVAENVILVMQLSRIAEGHGSKHPDAEGLSIYWPAKDRYDSAYEDLDFALATNWDEFLGEYYNFVDSVKVTAECPVNLLVTDPNGLRVGYNQETGTVVNEIPNATYSGPGSEPQEITIPNPSMGTYIIDAFGTGSGLYIITMESATSNGTIIESETWNGTAVPEEQYTENVKLNVDGELTFNYIAVTNIQPCKTVIGQGYEASINITVENQGSHIVTFNLTIYANTTIIHTFRNITLPIGNFTTIAFTWNTTGWAKGNYTISAYAWPPLGETDLTDNTLFADKEVCVTIPGDVDGDRDVDIYDIVRMAGIYGTTEEDPQFIANCDIDGDGDIDIYDIVAAAGNYGENW